MKRIIVLLIAMFSFTLFSCSSDDDTNVVANNDDNQTTSTDDTTSNTTNNPPSSSTNTSISGTIIPSTTLSKRLEEIGDDKFLVSAVSNSTGEAYTTYTGEGGEFNLDIPDEEKGNSFEMSVIDGNGNVVGVPMFGQDGNNAQVGLVADGESKLDSMFVGDKAAPIIINSDSLVIDTNLLAPLVNGNIAGLENNGKGEVAQNLSTANPNNLADIDGDGLPNILDADDNGNGIVDDFDPESSMGMSSGGEIFIFSNLKISSEISQPFYSGDSLPIKDIIKMQTVLTFSFKADPTKTLSEVYIDSSIAPSYLSKSTVSMGNIPWSSDGYKLLTQPDGSVQQWIHPNEIPNAGDAFIVIAKYTDGTTEKFIKMLNFVFYSIPLLQEIGTDADNLEPFGDLIAAPIKVDIEVPTNNSVAIDSLTTKDLIIKFQPPKDETGAFIENLDYAFEMFYNDSTNNQVRIDWTKTDISIDNFRGRYDMKADLIDKEYDVTTNTYTVTIPHELFLTAVTDESGVEKNIVNYKIDIAPQNSSNAAIMINLQEK